MGSTKRTNCRKHPLAAIACWLTKRLASCTTTTVASFTSPGLVADAIRAASLGSTPCFIMSTSYVCRAFPVPNPSRANKYSSRAAARYVFTHLLWMRVIKERAAPHSSAYRRNCGYEQTMSESSLIAGRCRLTSLDFRMATRWGSPPEAATLSMTNNVAGKHVLGIVLGR